MGKDLSCFTQAIKKGMHKEKRPRDKPDAVFHGCTEGCAALPASSRVLLYETRVAKSKQELHRIVVAAAKCKSNNDEDDEDDEHDKDNDNDEHSEDGNEYGEDY